MLILRDVLSYSKLFMLVLNSLDNTHRWLFCDQVFLSCKHFRIIYLTVFCRLWSNSRLFHDLDIYWYIFFLTIFVTWSIWLLLFFFTWTQIQRSILWRRKKFTVEYIVLTLLENVINFWRLLLFFIFSRLLLRSKLLGSSVLQLPFSQKLRWNVL
jgi:hypothetical protein